MAFITFYPQSLWKCIGNEWTSKETTNCSTLVFSNLINGLHLNCNPGTWHHPECFLRSTGVADITCFFALFTLVACYISGCWWLFVLTGREIVHVVLGFWVRGIIASICNWGPQLHTIPQQITGSTSRDSLSQSWSQSLSLKHSCPTNLTVSKPQQLNVFFINLFYLLEQWLKTVLILAV